MQIFLTVLLLFSCSSAFAQGISVSYLFPKNGYISAPVSPISLRGIGIGETFGMQSGFTLYNIPGLAMEELPFDYEKPLTGPHFALLVPAEGFVKIPAGVVIISITGGVFAWWNINTRINKGNMDRAFREFEKWDVLNTDFEIDDKIGFGWMAGLEFEVRVVSNVYLTFGAKYLSGASKTELTGSYIGGPSSGPIETKNIDIDNAEINLQGIEISLGVQLGE